MTIDEAMQRHAGLRAMAKEMARQRGDALAALRENAAAIADSIARTGRLVLCGMGGSHHVGTIVEPLYRGLGLDVRTITASDLLIRALPEQPRTILFTSQSGRSGELLQLLARPADHEERFALTLDAQSPLARQCQGALIGPGGPEQAFAATRSVIVTLALHGAILAALGQPQDTSRAVLEAADVPDVAPAVTALAGSEVIVLAGRHVMHGVAQSATLSFMELPRQAAIGFEGGQFRHGPFELLRADIGVILLRSAGPDHAGVAELAAAAVDAGSPTILLDAGGGPDLPSVIRIPLITSQGLAAATAAILTTQQLSISLALARVEGEIGTPLRTAKVTV